ncbi:MAG: NADPH-dependent F420 reductase [Actinobacteria bacterium]|nr:NADPH-dependent F420 reductase [Actinomycetota bacterium]
MKIGILGATGPEGRGLAARLADFGDEVFVGSRDPQRAADIVSEIHAKWGSRVESIVGVGNEDAAREAELVVLAVPPEAAGKVAGDLAPTLAGKIVVSMANALERQGDDFVAIIPPEGSIARAVAQAAPESRVATAFQHVPAKPLGDLERAIEGDVLVCSDDREAAAAVCDLVRRIPNLEAFDVGGLGNAVGIEAFTAVMLSANTRFRVRSSIRLVGLPREGH